ncbi:AAA family ATPase [Polaromonas sp.]|uniref:AAA family ATPase n=1 Tax=Polaromonas sp. TaxID=1869339 RepID=UPI003BB4F829
MKIQRFELVNFRGIANMSLTFTARTTALVGINGVGKSSVLDALAIALSNLTARVMGQAAKARSMSPDDIRLGADYARLLVNADLGEDSTTAWAVALNRKAGKHPAERSSDLTALNARAGLFESRLLYREQQGEPISLPLAVYYDVHRAVLDVPLRTRDSKKSTPRDAYNDALGHGGTDFRGFFTWFRNQEDAENERIRDMPSHRDKGLSAVRKAIEQFTHFKDLRIRRKHGLRMTVNKSGTELNVMQLSDGERCMLALVGDLARRLSLLNTERTDPLEGEGVVLIDEIDLHLHPRWQRTVVASLERTFPNCQFIVTTHSPQILGELKPEQIILFRPEGTSHPQVSYGLDSSQVLEEIMGAPARPPEVEQALSTLFATLERNELDAARAQLEALKELAPGIAELGGAQALLKRKEVLGR